MSSWAETDSQRQQAEVDGTPQSTASGATQPCVCPPKPAPPPKVIPLIVKVEWLDGPAKGVLGGAGLQFVNMPDDAKWTGGKLATNRRRLTHQPGYKVTFNQPGSHSFKVRLIKAGGNAVYSDAEQGRNGKFKAETEWVSGSTDGDGTAVVEVGSALTAAGGDSYSLEAQDDQATLVRSGSIKTIRAVHCVQIKMTGLTAVATSIADCIGEYDKHHVRLIDLPSVEMTRLHNVGTDTSALEANVETAWDGSQGKQKAPYALGIVFTDHLAVKNPDKTLSFANQTVGPGQPPLALPIVGAGLTDPAVEARALWRDLVPGEGWFISCIFTPTGGGPAVELAEAQCTPDAATGYSDTVNVDVSALAAGTGRIALTVNWVDRMRGGISLGGSPTVLICTRAWWRDETTASQNQTLVHELGHQFGMVPEGGSGELDAHADQYTGSGHVGSHCHHGVPAAANYGDSAAHAASTCVIFGATNGKLGYCSLCAPQVRKLDLSAGW